MRRALPVLAVLFVAAGCTDARQRAAVRAVEAHVGAKATCTKSTHPMYHPGVSTTVFVCDVKGGNGLCDRYRAAHTSRGWNVELERRAVGCVLPPS